MKLDFDKASKKMNKETNPIGRVCSEVVEGRCYGGL
jgi:hypothetical protein